MQPVSLGKLWDHCGGHSIPQVTTATMGGRVVRREGSENATFCQKWAIYKYLPAMCFPERVLVVVLAVFQ